ncbi:cupin-like domain-containing protein [Sphingomonas sp. 2R-10]|uniref:cupin-like domain-containing protein n=1 Tax=Sphingomonas sp. 2R-10 TaxID=3045148 RepID=UPI000F7A8336|nr:cupin-like domain-containing protein [Sphingomonas sp. 2R-10]MDJ0276979.1 cupin-like domain-containing protein [Sphingomonas sp. 2R-10]
MTRHGDWIDNAPRLADIPVPGNAAAFDALLDTARPVVLRGLAADWPAVAAAGHGHDAMAAYLRRFDGGRPLGLFAGAPEIDGRFFYRDDMRGFNFERGQIPLPVLLDALLQAADAPTPPALYAGASAAKEHFPGWTRDNVLPLPTGDATARVWIGNGSRVSAHFDMASNVAVVVAGRRRVVLFPPEQVANLYIGPLDVTMAGQPATMVDIERPDLARFPRFAKAQAHAVVADLAPGDAILIPTLWWHEIRASGALNVLVNYWWTRGTPDAPFLALVHAILAVRDRPAAERAALRTWFDHYVFGDDAAGVADHLPVAARGILGAPGAERDARIRGYLRQMLG